MTFPVLDIFKTIEAVCLAFLLVGLAVMFYRSRQEKRQAMAVPLVQAEIIEALSVYLGGNPDSTHLRQLAAAHPERLGDAIVQYQAVVAGRRKEVCDLAIDLGYVERWCGETHSTHLAVRRKAFACISSMSSYEPVHRLIGNIPMKAFQDADEQIRVEAARILLATGEPEEVARIFQAVLSDTSGVRMALAHDFSRHAIQLCEQMIPRLLPVHEFSAKILQMAIAWERALPLIDMRALADHPDTAIRLEVMRLLPFLPATAQNQLALAYGLRDTDSTVREAALAAEARLKSAELRMDGQLADALRVG